MGRILAHVDLPDLGFHNMSDKSKWESESPKKRQFINSIVCRKIPGHGMLSGFVK